MVDAATCQSVSGHAVRGAGGGGGMGNMHVCVYVWPGCLTGSPSGITSQHHLIGAARPGLPRRPPLPVRSTAIDRSYVSGHWYYSSVTSALWAAALLLELFNY